MRFKFTLLFSCFCLAFCLSFLGQYNYRLDLFSCFYLQYAVGGLVFAAHYFYRKFYSYMAAALFVFCIAAAKLYITYPAPEKTIVAQTIKIIQFNINFANSHGADIVKWITDKQSDASVLVFQEVTAKRGEELSVLSQSYPYYEIYPRDDSFGAMIMSKQPFRKIERKALPGTLVFYTEIELLSGIKIYEIHVLPPISTNYAGDRNRALQNIAAIISRDPARNKILVGDFNITPYSHWFAQLEKNSKLKTTMQNFTSPGGTWPSMPALIFRIPIDQLLASENFHVVEKYRGQDLGSDHLPVVTTLSFN